MEERLQDDALPYASFADVAASVGRDAAPSGRPVVCVQGLGFVGSAMAAVVASARDGDGPAYDVIGVDVPGAAGEAKVEAHQRGPACPSRPRIRVCSPPLSRGVIERGTSWRRRTSEPTRSPR